jgi:hypothetical protein
MNSRVNAFADLSGPPVFAPKPRRENPVSPENMERLAEDNNFVSRQAPKPIREPKKKRRVYKTGRNQQLNIKATAHTIERFIKMADEKHLPSGALLDLALDALERAGAHPQLDAG